MQKVIVTGYQTLKNTRRALGLDENAYLVKPVQAEKIIKTVRRQLAERERELKERYVLLEDSENRHDGTEYLVLNGSLGR